MLLESNSEIEMLRKKIAGLLLDDAWYDLEDLSNELELLYDSYEDIFELSMKLAIEDIMEAAH